jgi:hypothetical protein
VDMRLSNDPKGLGFLESVITNLDASRIPQTSSTTMSAESPIYVSSTESSPASTPATSRESSPAVTEWVHDPELSTPNPLPCQAKIDLWLASANPRPTSEEVRIFIRDVGVLFQHSLSEDHRREKEWHEERLEVRVRHPLTFLD